MGTPTKLTPELIEIVRQATSEGRRLESVAALAGVHRSTLHRWYRAGEKEAKRRQRGRDPDPNLDLQVLLFSACELGDADLEKSALDIIQQAAKGGLWQAAAWLLERRFPESWSNVARELLKEYKRANKRMDEFERQQKRNNPWYGREDTET